ncbi:MAG: hypothetical protein K0R31_2168 [Clostridiales bacterium]|jgi:hypothetical protein|nr:hypothetical protein [Clostridiales bacterium]
MDQLEFEKARRLRKIAERAFPEPVADFSVKRFADGQFTTAAEGSFIEIATMIAKGLHDIEERYPEARICFSLALREYLEG